MEKLTAKEQLVFQKIKEFISDKQKLTVRAIQVALGYASPRSISVILDQMIRKGWVYRDTLDHIKISPQYTTDSYETRNIPLIGAIACGMPIFAEENIETKIPISTKLLSPSDEYFFLRAEWDSMNQKWVESGDLVLIKRTNTPENGKIVVALLNDEATLKEYRERNGCIYLIPHSDNPRHKPIILDESDGNVMIQWIFVRSFPGDLFS
jgi:SOS regulatory protein LexA